MSLTGEFLPVQLIFKGLTDICHPKVNFPKGFYVTHSPNHWSNEKIHLEYLLKAIFPYVENIRKPLEADRKALLIYEVFYQTTNLVTEALEKNNILSKKVPNNHTVHFHPLDIKSTIGVFCIKQIPGLVRTRGICAITNGSSTFTRKCNCKHRNPSLRKDSRKRSFGMRLTELTPYRPAVTTLFWKLISNFRR